MVEAQSLILSQLDDENNYVYLNRVGTRSGKITQDPKGPKLYKKEQEQKRLTVNTKIKKMKIFLTTMMIQKNLFIKMHKIT